MGSKAFLDGLTDVRSLKRKSPTIRLALRLLASGTVLQRCDAAAKRIPKKTGHVGQVLEPSHHAEAQKIMEKGLRVPGTKYNRDPGIPGPQINPGHRQTLVPGRPGTLAYPSPGHTRIPCITAKSGPERHYLCLTVSRVAACLMGRGPLHRVEDTQARVLHELLDP